MEPDVIKFIFDLFAYLNLERVGYFFFFMFYIIYSILLLFSPFIYHKYKKKMYEIEVELELLCNAQYEKDVEYNVELRHKYLQYKSILFALNPFNMSPSIYYEKPLLKKDFHDLDYVLFLRGFEKDSYLHDIRLRAKRQFESFSEYFFVHFANKYIKTYAVGMTKEIEPAVGANRIYLSDESWKEDVVDLMEKAELILLLINDKPNCIWEIEQSIGFKSKTIYLIDDIAKYRTVVEILKQNKILGFPNLPIQFNCFFYSSLDRFVLNPLSNSIESYEKSVDYIFKKIFKKQLGFKRYSQKATGIGTCLANYAKNYLLKRKH